MKKNNILIGAAVFMVIACSAIIAYDAGTRSAKKNYADGKTQPKYVEDTQSEIIKYVNDANQSESYYELQPETAIIKDEAQEISVALEPYAYPPLIVQKGIPVKLFIIADKNNLNECNNEIVIPDYRISKALETGENLIEFTPTEAGVIPYSCWMGMINSTISVVDDINSINTEKILEQIDALPLTDSCCSMMRR